MTYTELKKRFLTQHPRCAVYPQRAAVDIHHKRGRLGTLEKDTRFWVAVSRAGHDWIHQNPAAARKRDLLCENGQWNTQVPLEGPQQATTE